MTYERSLHYYRLFKDIETAHHADSYLSVKARDREVKQALIYYMAEKGVVMTEGKFYQWWEYNESTGDVRPAKVRMDSFVGSKSIVRTPGCKYVSAWDRKQAIKHFKQEINHEQGSESRSNNPVI